MRPTPPHAQPRLRRHPLAPSSPRWASLVFVALLATSCGGDGGGGNPEIESLNGIAVPLAPDTVANAATLTGVDSNGNALRDDVERSIALRAPSSAAFAKSVSVSAAVQAVITEPAPDRAAVLARFKVIHCAVLAAAEAGVEADPGTSELLNTQARLDAYNANAALLGGFESSELGECP